MYPRSCSQVFCSPIDASQHFANEISVNHENLETYIPQKFVHTYTVEGPIAKLCGKIYTWCFHIMIERIIENSTVAFMKIQLPRW